MGVYGSEAKGRVAAMSTSVLAALLVLLSLSLLFCCLLEGTGTRTQDQV